MCRIVANISSEMNLFTPFHPIYLGHILILNPSTPRSYKWSISFRFCYQAPKYIFSFHIVAHDTSFDDDDDDDVILLLIICHHVGTFMKKQKIYNTTIIKQSPH